jgi:hypothetical protein
MRSYEDVLDYVCDCSEWMDVYELEAAAEAAFDAVADLIDRDVCTPYGRGFGLVDLAAEVQS